MIDMVYVEFTGVGNGGFCCTTVLTIWQYIPAVVPAKNIFYTSIWPNNLSDIIGTRKLAVLGLLQSRTCLH